MNGNYPYFNNKQQNDDSGNVAAKLGFIGTLISTIGDGIQTIAAGIAIEESRIADEQQKQELAKLQSQIDELKKEQTKNSSKSNDTDELNKLLKRIADQLDKNNAQEKKK